MRLPVDTTTVRFVAAGPPEPSIDYATKQQRTDDSGQPLFQVHLLAVGGGARDVISVRVAGEPKGIAELQPVKVTELVASTWSMDDRFGVSFRAQRIEPLATRAAS